jgi:hypothetical protein
LDLQLFRSRISYIINVKPRTKLINITLSLPESIIHKIDKERGDINRSKYVVRLLEAGCQSLQYQDKNLRHPKFRVGRSEALATGEVVHTQTALESDTVLE